MSGAYIHEPASVIGNRPVFGHTMFDGADA